jgi:hypothetical protein
VEVPGDGRLIELEVRLDLASAHLGLREEIDDPQSDRVRQRLQEAGPTLVAQICIYSHISNITSAPARVNGLAPEKPAC